MEFRFLECRADGREITGAALNYGDVARLRYGREQFDSQPFGDVSALDVIANIQHNRQRPIARTGGGGLVLTDSPERLALAATLPKTRDADDALELVKTGVLRGWSVEFDPVRESQEGDLRRIHSALLSGVGLVDRPAYRQSTPLIRQDGEGLSGMFPYGQDQVIADTGRRRKQRVMPGAFDYAIRQQDREITLLLGSPDKPLASKQAGTLQLEDSNEALHFRVNRLPQTSYAIDFLALLRARAIVPGIIPFFTIPALAVLASGQPNEYEEEEEGNAGVFRHVILAAVLTAVVIQFRAPRGNPGEVNTRAEDDGLDLAETESGLAIPKRRKRLWL